VDGAQVGVFKETDEVRFRRLLERQHGGALEAQIRLKVLRDFAHETLERELADQEFRRLLVLATSSKRTTIHRALVSQAFIRLRARRLRRSRFILGLTLASRHAPNLTKRDGTRTVPVRFLNAYDERARKNRVHPLVSPRSTHSRASTHVPPHVAIAIRPVGTATRESVVVTVRSSRATSRSRARAPPVVGADFLAALVANCLRGAFPPVDLRAVCFVRAMSRIHARASADDALRRERIESLLDES